MTNRNRTVFYTDSVDAKAAYITDGHGLVIARAVLFTNVTDQDGKKWRLLERQYSSGGNDTLKRLLVEKLIQENHIDGYKAIGASCNEPDAFVSLDGSSLAGRKFEIDCRLDKEDILSYQDSFNGMTMTRKRLTIINRHHTAIILTPQNTILMGMRTNGMIITSIIVKKPSYATGTVRKSMWIWTT